MIWYYQNRFISPGFHLLHIQRQRKNDFNDVLCKKGFVVYYKFVYVFLLLTYTFCSTNIILGVDTLKWKIFFMLFSSEIDFHNLICIFNQARLCLRDIWITIFDDFFAADEHNSHDWTRAQKGGFCIWVKTDKKWDSINYY